jgi:uncharacterized protein YjiS (DUF1127 family)
MKSPRKEDAMIAADRNLAAPGRREVHPLDALWRWIVRTAETARQRRALARLDDRALRDIGLTRADVEAETAKPFWHG